MRSSCLNLLVRTLMVAFVVKQLVSLDCKHVNFYDPQNDAVPDDDVEQNKTVHDDIWSGTLSPVAQDFTTLTVQWEQPQKPETLCTFGVHYYPRSEVKELSSHVTIYVPKDMTEMVIKNLKLGTAYHVYVEAVFDVAVPEPIGTNPVLKSNLLKVMTKGIGPDNPCNCNPAGTKDGSLDTCDVHTGKCDCKVEPLTNDLKCGTCVEHAYMDEQLGCTECDDCDPVKSTGSCLPERGGGMKCICRNSFLGKHCRECKLGYYSNETTCKPCKCQGNGNDEADKYCKRTCTTCVSSATGEQCELRCLPGYVGNATEGKCHVEISVSRSGGHQAVVAVVVIIIIVLVVVLIVIILRATLRRRRRNDHLKATMRGTGGVDFSTLVEEPDQIYRTSDKSPIALST